MAKRPPEPLFIGDPKSKSTNLTCLALLILVGFGLGLLHSVLSPLLFAGLLLLLAYDFCLAGNLTAWKQAQWVSVETTFSIHPINLWRLQNGSIAADSTEDIPVTMDNGLRFNDGTSMSIEAKYLLIDTEPPTKFYYDTRTINGERAYRFKGFK